MAELTTTTTTWSRDLPIEIVTDILARLPSKSLLRFRCVCKSWLHLISGRNFIQLHRNLNKNGHVLVRYELFDSHFDSHFDRSMIFSLLCEKTFVVEQERIGLELPSSSSLTRSKFDYVGCSNGLVCLSCSVQVFSMIYLWNPSIRKVKVLPRGLLSNFNFDRTSVVVAFGFVPQMNDYRVIKIVQGYPEKSDVNVVKVEIYSLSTNSWKLVENVCPFPMVWYDNRASRTVNGVFHVVAHDYINKEVIILSVDMAKETFNRINLGGAGFRHLSKIRKAQPVMIGEFFLVLCHNYAPRDREGTVDIWEKTKELGAVECWTKKLTIDHYVAYLGFLRNGELVLIYYDQVSSYDPRLHEIKDLQLGGGVPGRLLLFTEYMESLELLDQGD